MQWIRAIHKWVSVVVGIQFLLWLGSGIFFNLMDHQKAGGHTYRTHNQQSIDDNASALVDPKSVLKNVKDTVSVEHIHLLGQPYYLLTHLKGLYRNFENDYTLVNAYSGKEARVDEEFAIRLAKQSYSGPGDVSSVTLLQAPLSEFPKQRNASWQVNFSDTLNTSVYIEAGSGYLVGHSDDHKRLADIFFMLHFMDYGNEGSFNNLQIILFAFITLWLSFTGIIWTVDLGLRGQYKIKLFSSQRNIKLFDKNQHALGEIRLSTGTNMLDGLAERGIALPSTCGGGGTCGRCKVIIPPSAKVTSADEVHFSQSELRQGFRLACQHFSNDVEHMTLLDVTDAKTHTLMLTQSTFVSPTIKELRFKVDAPPLMFKAGAFMRFFIPAASGSSKPANIPDDFTPYWQDVNALTYEHDACSRSYSLSEPSSLTDDLVFTIKLQQAPGRDTNPGIGSNYLGNLTVGSKVNAIGAFEEFFASESGGQQPMVFIGAGSGMAPLKCIILDQLKAKHASRTIYFFYGAQTEEDLIYKEQLYSLSKEHENFNYIPVLSRSDGNWLGATGYAQHVTMDNLTEKLLSSAEFYLCGPDAMMSEAILLLSDRGVDKSRIQFDSFS